MTLKSLLFKTAATAIVACAASAASACPDWTQSGVQTMRGDGQFFWTPRSYEVVAGGSSNVANCQVSNMTDYPSWGYVAMTPDFELTFDKGVVRDLTLRVDGTCDTTLLVNGPNGRWFFNDDAAANDTDPYIRFPAAEAGVYDIWVGTFGSATCRATLVAETF